MMRSTVFAAVALGSVVALVGFAGAANAIATIDLIWDATGTNELDNALENPILQLNVILTAGSEGSEGAGVSVDFELVEERLVLIGYSNTPSTGNESPLPFTLDFPSVNGLRVEFINSTCICDAGIGIGLLASESHQLGTVTFNNSLLINGEFEIISAADGLRDGVLDGNTNDITGTTTFNSAILINVVPEPGGLTALESGIAMLAFLYRRRRHSSRRS